MQRTMARNMLHMIFLTVVLDIIGSESSNLGKFKSRPIPPKIINRKYIILALNVFGKFLNNKDMMMY
jgi:hypothetical protein